METEPCGVRGITDCGALGVGHRLVHVGRVVDVGQSYVTFGDAQKQLLTEQA